MENLDSLLELMSQLGFSPYESRAYLALLQKSPLNGHEVSRLAGIPPSKIYETLQRLQQKGSVMVYHSDPILYAPVPYQELLARLQSELASTFQALEERLDKLAPQQDTSLTWSLAGSNHIMNKLVQCCKKARTDIFAALWDEEMELLAPVLREAHSRGVELQLAIYGAFDLGVPTTYDLTLCGRSAQKRLGGRRLSVLVKDQDETIVAELSGSGNDQGIWTQNQVVSLLTTEYIKDEIMSRCLIEELGEERYQALRQERPALISMLRYEGPRKSG
jgi:HTH-type transcriptional regulator, sugar sensing transcriptional regulator